MPLYYATAKKYEREVFVRNLRTELKAGRQLKQALAIAYSVERKGRQLRKQRKL